MKYRNLFFLSQLIFSLIILTSCQPQAAPSTAPANMSASKQMKIKERNKVLHEKMQQNPCAVEIWADENYQNDNDVVIGPLESTDMKNLPGANINDWSDEIDSLKVGPKATVIVWQDPNYHEAFQSFGPGTEKTNLRGDPNFSDEISSIRISCAP